MSNKYGRFIEEAFIEPIRSVLIVDDDYPTIEEVLDAQINNPEDATANSPKKWYTDPQGVKDVIDEFRVMGMPYLLDIHDAQNLTPAEELTGAEHLHQTDLLILDYELDRSKKGDGTLAVKIARNLMSNNHFNLVVVHTNEDVNLVFQNFLLGLLHPRLEQLSEDKSALLDEAYTKFDADDDTVQGPSFNESLEQAFGFDQYILHRKNPNVLGKVISGIGAFRAAKTIFEGYKVPQEYWLLLSENALVEYEAKMSKDIMCGKNLGITDFSVKSVKWIRSNKAFITFSYKPNGEKLIDSLRKALLDWNPKPSRLFLTKLIAEIDEHGVEVQEQALGDNHSAAYWYHRILEASDIELETRVNETIQRHADEMMRNILPGIGKFAKNLAKSERKNGSGKNFNVVKKHYKVDLSNEHDRKKCHLHHNALVSNKEPTGWHLQTGHIFEFENNIWVCVSAACDTVPEQISSSQIKTHGERLRFNAVKLHRQENQSPADVQSNRFLFIKIDGKIAVFAFTENNFAAPDWATLFANDRGIIKNTMVLSISRIEQDAKTKELVAKPYDAKIVGQLRYEYALNLIQKLNGSLSRIGLDFAG